MQDGRESLRVPEGVWEPLRVSESPWGCLRVPEGVWESLILSWGSTCQFSYHSGTFQKSCMIARLFCQVLSHLKPMEIKFECFNNLWLGVKNFQIIMVLFRYSCIFLRHFCKVLTQMVSTLNVFKDFFPELTTLRHIGIFLTCFWTTAGLILYFPLDSKILFQSWQL